MMVSRQPATPVTVWYSMALCSYAIRMRRSDKESSRIGMQELKHGRWTIHARPGNGNSITITGAAFQGAIIRNGGVIKTAPFRSILSARLLCHDDCHLKIIGNVKECKFHEAVSATVHSGPLTLGRCQWTSFRSSIYRDHPNEIETCRACSPFPDVCRQRIRSGFRSSRSRRASRGRRPSRA
ncbi:hypothetical protein P3T23_009306 [Paraburkholderia sp. GAS448]